MKHHDTSNYVCVCYLINEFNYIIYKRVPFIGDYVINELNNLFAS